MVATSRHLLGTLHGLLSTHRRRDASVDHGVLKTLERRTLLDLSLLELAKEFIFEAFELHALLLVIGDLFLHVVGLLVDFLPRHGALHLNEVVLLGQAVGFLLANLLLAELGLVEVLFAHAVQVVLHLLFLSAHLLHSGHLLVSEVSVSEVDLLSFFLPAFASNFSVLLLLQLALLLLSLLLQDLIVVLILQILQLSCLLFRLFDLFNGPHLFIL